jgi:hypothetical protein
MAYDTGDRPYLYTSYNAVSGGSVVNQVEDVYNGLGQLITEYQAASGAVNTSSTPSVHQQQPITEHDLSQRPGHQLQLQHRPRQ